MQPGCEPAYTTQPTPAAFRPRVFFLWKPLPLAAQPRLGAQHSVFFTIDTAPPFSVAHLTFTLLHFTYLAIHSYVTADYDFNPHRLPRMTRLAYHITATSVHGIAYFDNLHHAFSGASTRGLYLLPTSTSPRMVITSWPAMDAQQLLSGPIHNYTPVAHYNTLSR